MASIIKTDAEIFADKFGLTSFDIGSKQIVRPGIKHTLTLKVTRSGKQILVNNREDIALLKRGDTLEMRGFNRFVKRAFQLESKGIAIVTVETNKKGMYGVKHRARFMPFNALRGYVSFGVISLSENKQSERGEVTTI